MSILLLISLRHHIDFLWVVDVFQFGWWTYSQASLLNGKGLGRQWLFRKQYFKGRHCNEPPSQVSIKSGPALPVDSCVCIYPKVGGVWFRSLFGFSEIHLCLAHSSSTLPVNDLRLFVSSPATNPFFKLIQNSWGVGVTLRGRVGGAGWGAG